MFCVHIHIWQCAYSYSYRWIRKAVIPRSVLLNYKQRAALACNGNNLRLNAIKLDSKFQIFIFASLLYSNRRQFEFISLYHFSVVIFQTIDLNSLNALEETRISTSYNDYEGNTNFKSKHFLKFNDKPEILIWRYLIFFNLGHFCARGNKK